jgi:hypothetical protein
MYEEEYKFCKIQKKQTQINFEGVIELWDIKLDSSSINFTIEGCTTWPGKVRRKSSKTRLLAFPLTV